MLQCQKHYDLKHLATQHSYSYIATIIIIYIATDYMHITYIAELLSFWELARGKYVNFITHAFLILGCTYNGVQNGN